MLLHPIGSTVRPAIDFEGSRVSHGPNQVKEVAGRLYEDAAALGYVPKPVSLRKSLVLGVIFHRGPSKPPERLFVFPKGKNFGDPSNRIRKSTAPHAQCDPRSPQADAHRPAR